MNARSAATAYVIDWDALDWELDHPTLDPDRYEDYKHPNALIDVLDAKTRPDPDAELARENRIVKLSKREQRLCERNAHHTMVFACRDEIAELING